MSSVGSAGAPDVRHLRLVQACASGNEAVVRELLDEAISPGGVHSSWTATGPARDALRHGLQRAAARGNVSIARLLLEAGAEVDARSGTSASGVIAFPAAGSATLGGIAVGGAGSGVAEIAAVFRAAENGHVAATRLLLDKAGARVDARDRLGRTPLFPAALRGYVEVVRLLIAAGADVDARDKEERTVLIVLAEEKEKKAGKAAAAVAWDRTVLRALLEAGANVEAADRQGRTALIWAADMAKAEMLQGLIDGVEGKTPANIEARTNRGRTALHFASERGHEAIVDLLLRSGADPRVKSDGGWTPLHNAAEKGNAGVVARLLDAGADVNAELSTGLTALHWAAHNGREDVVRLLLAREDTKLGVKDADLRTPLICAAERGHQDIVRLLSPANNAARLGEAEREACRQFEATVWDFGIEGEPRGKQQRKLVTNSTVADLLYGWDGVHDKPAIPTQAKNLKHKQAFRWIHLPANNVAWADALLTNAFIEAGHRDVDDFKQLQKCFSQEHRGPMAHANFMRTFAHRMPPMGHHNPAQRQPLGEMSSNGLVLSPSDGQQQAESSAPAIRVEPATPMKASLATLPEKEAVSGARPEKKKSKAERQGAKKASRGEGPPASGKGAAAKAVKLAERAGAQPVKNTGPSGKLVLFMPYLHYESDASRLKMARAIKRTSTYNAQDPQLQRPEKPTRDDLLIEAYLNAQPCLHPRRTLDQFFYHSIDTSERDQDQVVYRYCKRRRLEEKIFMVDQLWLWIVGKDLIITSFPQRWQQPRNDPLNVLDGIIEDMNAKTRAPVKSVYEFAMLIIGRCSGMFDRHKLNDENYQFVDMFESSIGHVTNRETELFDRFNKASAFATKWLRESRRGRATRRGFWATLEEDADSRDDPRFMDALLAIGTETRLLAEIKDIRDELNMIRMVLRSQTQVMADFADHLWEELGGRKSDEAADVRKKSKDQLKVIDGHIANIDRMDKHADLIYTSLTHLLDLKQKHSNSFEARFARAQAMLQAQQGQTIMVFTIVTIVFLPMSFIASVFAINVQEFPKQGGQTVLPWSFVAKFMFGIGFGISIPLIFLALAVDDLRSLARKAVALVNSRLSHPPPDPNAAASAATAAEDSPPATRGAPWAMLTRRPTRVDKELSRGARGDGRPARATARRDDDGYCDGLSRSSGGRERDLSPLSDRTFRSSQQGARVSWARGSFDAHRLAV